jgi:hypothetical protein
MSPPTLTFTDPAAAKARVILGDGAEDAEPEEVS